MTVVISYMFWMCNRETIDWVKLSKLFEEGAKDRSPEITQDCEKRKFSSLLLYLLLYHWDAAFYQVKYVMGSVYMLIYRHNHNEE